MKFLMFFLLLCTNIVQGSDYSLGDEEKKLNFLWSQHNAFLGEDNQFGSSDSNQDNGSSYNDIPSFVSLSDEDSAPQQNHFEALHLQSGLSSPISCLPNDLPNTEGISGKVKKKTKSTNNSSSSNSGMPYDVSLRRQGSNSACSSSSANNLSLPHVNTDQIDKLANPALQFYKESPDPKNSAFGDTSESQVPSVQNESPLPFVDTTMVSRSNNQDQLYRSHFYQESTRRLSFLSRYINSVPLKINLINQKRSVRRRQLDPEMRKMLLLSRFGLGLKQEFQSFQNNINQVNFF